MSSWTCDTHRETDAGTHLVWRRSGRRTTVLGTAVHLAPCQDRSRSALCGAKVNGSPDLVPVRSISCAACEDEADALGLAVPALVETVQAVPALSPVAARLAS